jgi:putative nucleotidyltransferase with HDIG domain
MEHGHLSFETVHQRKDGSLIPTEVSARRIAWDGQPVMMSICRDITERKQAEEELKQTLERLRKSLAGTIQAMSMMVETRDPYTAGHQRKVSTLARAIAQEMGLSNDMVDTIRMAGIIHDIGKISIPAEILVKPGILSDIEMNLIEAHSQTGYDIVKDAELPCPIAQIVLQHHERLDGSGYPQGLKDGQILLEAQIISVADVVEAISSHRPYRPGFGIDIALEEIEKNKGILYDEQAVEICVKLFREKGFKLD